MTKQEKERTEEQILNAAKEVFIRKGMDGARMQEIADEAGINKALLHYYYRSKELLFKSVFRLVIKAVVPKIESIILSDIDFFEKIKLIVDSYISLLQKNSFIPMFVLRELNRNPDELYNEFKLTGIDPSKFKKVLTDEMEKGTIRKMPPEHFLINVLSLCIFPIAARPLFQRLLFDNDKNKYKKFIEERKELTAEYIINAIKI